MPDGVRVQVSGAVHRAPSKVELMSGTVWVALLGISRRTAHKLSTRHHLDADELRKAILCVHGLPFTWDDDPKRGRRAIVEAQVGGRRVLVVLYPTNHPMGDEWNLGSAYPIN